MVNSASVTSAQQETNPSTKSNAPVTSGKLGIQHLYVKEQSAKVHNAPAIFKQEAKPETNLELNIQNRIIDQNQFEVTLSVHLTLKLQQQTALVIEVEQAGIFQLEDFAAADQAFILGAYCPSVLYPYARKVLSDLMLAAGFAPITSPPINFEQMYYERTQTEDLATTE